MKQRQIYIGLLSISLHDKRLCTRLAAVSWPSRNSTSPQTGIYAPGGEWPEVYGRLIWASVLRICGQRWQVYLLDRDDSIGDNMRCFNLTDGIELWNFAYEAPGVVMFPGSRSVPALDAIMLLCGHNGECILLWHPTHKTVWNKNVWKDFGVKNFYMGYHQCPLVYGDLLILASRHPMQEFVAYEKLTGNV